MFSNNDYSSPIFNKEGNIIGNAFKYNNSIKDFSNLIINRQLRTNIKLFFNHFELAERLNKSEILVENYYIIKNSYLQKYKDFYKFSDLEQILNKNNIANKTIQALKDNITDKNKIINDKRIILIIKHLPSHINPSYNLIEKKNNK